jgi:hypothetical protein
MDDEVLPSLPNSMHPWKIAIPGSWEGGMAIFQGYIEVGGKDDTSSSIP